MIVYRPSLNFVLKLGAIESPCPALSETLPDDPGRDIALIFSRVQSQTHVYPVSDLQFKIHAKQRLDSEMFCVVLVPAPPSGSLTSNRRGH